jgi:hypothetical protein
MARGPTGSSNSTALVDPGPPAKEGAESKIKPRAKTDLFNKTLLFTAASLLLKPYKL